MDMAALESLLKSQPTLWRGRDRYTDNNAIPTGFSSLDCALPARGWCVGGVTELLLEQQAIGELSLLLPALQKIINPENINHSQWAAFINPPHVPYAPALINAGIDLDKLLIINSGDDTNTLWATEQVLRTGLFGAVVSWVQRSSTQQQRRLQLAAESGNTWATVYRPLSARDEHSPVSARICLSTHRQQLQLDIIKVRAGSPQTVRINSDEFDASQGAEWPIPRASIALRQL